MSVFLSVLTVIVPVLVAVVGIIPAISANRKKTEESIAESDKTMKEQVSKIQGTLDRHIREDEDEAARTCRYRILRFYDEMCEKRKHSESHFEDILDDIDKYEAYCAAHPDFRNSRGGVAMKAIRETYAEVKARGGFLTHDER